MNEETRMISQHILKELDIEEGEGIVYFEQFAALMEGVGNIDYDIFAELILTSDPEALAEVIDYFFEDVTRGVPDNDLDMYSALEARRTLFRTLAGHLGGRGAGFLTDELYTFREWFLEDGTVLCTQEDGTGSSQWLSPCQALMLYREEKLSGTKFDYDFSQAPLSEIDQYMLSLLEELENEEPQSSFSWDDDLDYLPDELPEDFDPSAYIPGETDLSEYMSDFDPYTDGFIDRDNPVIDGIDYEQY